MKTRSKGASGGAADPMRVLFFPGSTTAEIDEARALLAKQQRLTNRRPSARALERSSSKISRWFTYHEPNRRLVFPEDGELQDIDDAVRSCADTRRKSRVIESHRCYEIVLGKYPKLRRRIAASIARFGINVPIRPLELIERFGMEDGEIASQAREFLKVALQVRKGERAVNSVNWDDFREMLLRYLNEDRQKKGQRALRLLETRVGRVAGDSRLLAYTVVLEIELDDRQWWRKYGTGSLEMRNWLERTVGDPELLQQLGKVCVLSFPPEELAKRCEMERQVRHKEAARRRQQRHRSKKAAQKA